MVRKGLPALSFSSFKIFKFSTVDLTMRDFICPH